MHKPMRGESPMEFRRTVRIAIWFVLQSAGRERKMNFEVYI